MQHGSAEVRVGRLYNGPRHGVEVDFYVRIRACMLDYVYFNKAAMFTVFVDSCRTF